MRRSIYPALRTSTHKSTLWLKIVVLFVAGIVPVFTTQIAIAEQLSSRRVTISTSRASATNTQYDFRFSWGSATAVQSIVFQFCTTPLGTCTLPPSMDVSNDDHTTLDAHTNFPTNGTAFAEVASNTGNCNDTGSAATVTMYCINRTQAASATGTNATVDLGGITNPSLSGNPYRTVYVRITLFSDNAFATPVHEGTVAAGITQQLTATGRVQERLEFCVSAIDDDDPLPDECTNAPTATTIDLGVIDNTNVAVSPVEPTATNGANDSYGIAMINTNASGGAALTYYPEQATNVTASDTHQLRSFRVLPTDCSATTTSETDQCFVSASPSGEVFDAGDERFGMYIACVDGNGGGTGQNLTANFNAAYDGDDDNIAFASGCETEALPANNEGEFAFDDTGTPVELVRSNSVVDNEVVKLRFAATASPTTPTGTYVVVTTYIATVTF